MSYFSAKEMSRFAGKLLGMTRAENACKSSSEILCMEEYHKLFLNPLETYYTYLLY